MGRGDELKQDKQNKRRKEGTNGRRTGDDKSTEGTKLASNRQNGMWLTPPASYRLPVSVLLPAVCLGAPSSSSKSKGSGATEGGWWGG